MRIRPNIRQKRRCNRNNYNSPYKSLSKNKPNKLRKVAKDMSKKPMINYDYESDVLYIVAKKAEEEEFIEVAPGINVELDDQGHVIGIEILNASKCLKPIAKPLYKNMQMV